MLAFVPPLGALFQCLVVALLMFLDQSLQADVSANFVPELVKLEEKQEARDAAVAVAEGMYAEKIRPLKILQGGAEKMV